MIILCYCAPLTNHSEEVRVVDAALLLGLVHPRVVQDAGHGQAEVGAEHVDKHGLAQVTHLEQEETIVVSDVVV